MTQTVTSRISDDLFNELEELAGERNLSRSEAISMLIAHGVDADLDYGTQADYLEGVARLEARADDFDGRLEKLDEKIGAVNSKVDKITLWPVSLWILILILLVWVLWGL